ncbi:hypothetical protein P5V30_20905 [Mycobacteroides abscessus subsp. abscessus]|uniref:hypothetical protein n=1 Tax=Mycobacteroides abscessus TaxID=36809 RepID=UPI00092B2F99|nr:hypothetical protein [Mycobacteroides abscessus]MDO2986995.1 hypothetical protein [Mycobacteroides abscessus subsp. abscessus]SID30757.1 Uncharacterised protein [Mycobacteroides abscessus subsp. abscessus]SIJ91573.1 Uncharacterised protein [Mycobacteroides abscessus subsp. abscessus]
MPEIRVFGVPARGDAALVALIATAAVTLAANVFVAGWSMGRGNIEAADRPERAAVAAPGLVENNIGDLMSARADVLNACQGTGTPIP